MACRRLGVRIPLAPLDFPDLCSVVQDQAKNLGALRFCSCSHRARRRHLVPRVVFIAVAPVLITGLN
jgi:hypothetical protein